MANIETAVLYALERLALSAEPKQLRETLERQAGTNPAGETVYRADLYVADYLEQTKGLASGEGAVFRVEQRAKAYRAAQAAQDAALGLTVPKGTEAVVSGSRRPASGSVPIVVTL